MKIIKFNGNYYYECQYSGIKLDTRYGVPKKTGSERDGSYADAACAVAHILQQIKDGKIKEKAAKEKLALIHTDLGLHKAANGETLKPAPELDPSNPDFSYREKFPWMYKPHLHIPIDVDVQAGKADSRKAKAKKLNVFVVPVEGELSDQVLEKAESLDFEVPFTIRKIGSGAQKSKDLLILSSEDSEVVNHRVSSLFTPKENEVSPVYHGNAIVICKLGEEKCDLFTEGSPDKKRKSSKKSKEENDKEVDDLLSEFLPPTKKQHIE
jgi:hypothetical protein